MGSSDEEFLLEPCCLNYHQKKKEKVVGAGNVLKKNGTGSLP